MHSNELSFEMELDIPAQELVEPRTAPTEAIEFDDLDTVLNPVVPSANESEGDVEVELELDACDIDNLLGASGKLSL
ncbi:MAG: hypothetical protein ABW034_16665 [Steroidobacteraceae bacterium]